MEVNSATPVYQQDSTSGLYFRAEVAHNAGVNTRYTPVTVTANSVTTDSWLQYVPPAAEALTYDADGNLTSDGRWFYKWDGENRLIRMDSLAQTNPAVKSMRLIFTYDGLSRRIRKEVYQDSPAHTVTSSHGTLIKKEHYVYDGWNLVLTAADNGVGTPGSNTGGNITKRVASYIWGPDIGSKPGGRSSWQEAGGVGGLLMVIDGEDSAITYPGVDYNGAAAGLGTAPADPVDDNYIPLMDHLGNVTGLHQLTHGNLALQGTLDYDAFGREIRSTGSACDKVPFHFSTKFSDPESGLNYYGYRFYDPNNGRWINRDPIGEEGGENLYRALESNLTNKLDVLGLSDTPCPDAGYAMTGWDAAGKDSLFRAYSGGAGSDRFHTEGHSGADMLRRLSWMTQINCCCIKGLRLAGEGGPSGLGGTNTAAGEHAGFYEEKKSWPSESDHPDAGREFPFQRDISDLKNAQNNGRLKFCKDCTIIVHSCGQSESFTIALAAATGCKVITAVGGKCSPANLAQKVNTKSDSWRTSGRWMQSHGGGALVPVPGTKNGVLNPNRFVK